MLIGDPKGEDRESAGCAQACPLSSASNGIFKWIYFNYVVQKKKKNKKTSSQNHGFPENCISVEMLGNKMSFLL